MIKANRVLTGGKCFNFGRNIFQATLVLKHRIAQLIKSKQWDFLASFDLRQARLAPNTIQMEKRQKRNGIFPKVRTDAHHMTAQRQQ